MAVTITQNGQTKTQRSFFYLHQRYKIVIILSLECHITTGEAIVPLQCIGELKVWARAAEVAVVWHTPLACSERSR
eukprot:COSAG05_NODE_572_length_8615_cov_58.796031_3_plen_76_part_00